MKFLEIIKGHKYIVLIGIASAIYTTGNGAVFFLLPLLLGKLTENFMLLGLMIAIPSVFSMFFDIPTGELADCVGRKKLVILGLGGMIVFALLLPFADSLETLAFLLLLLGFSNQLINVPIRSYVMEIAPKDKTSEYFGVQLTGMQLGFTLAPLIAGVLLSEDILAGRAVVSLLYIVTCALAIVLVHFGVRETLMERKSLACGIRSVITKDNIFMKGLMEYRALKSAGLVIFLLTLSFIITDGLIWAIEPLYNNLGIGTEMVGVILSMFVLPFVLFQIPAGFLADRVGKVKVLMFGLFLAGSFLIIFGLTRDVYIMITAAFVSTLGLALAVPATDGLLTDVSSGKDRGSVVGVWDVAEDLGYIIGPIMGGIIAELYQDITIPFIFLGAFLLLLIVPVLFIRNKKPEISHNAVP